MNGFIFGEFNILVETRSSQGIFLLIDHHLSSCKFIIFGWPNRNVGDFLYICSIFPISTGDFLRVFPYVPTYSRDCCNIFTWFSPKSLNGFLTHTCCFLRISEIYLLIFHMFLWISPRFPTCSRRCQDGVRLARLRGELMKKAVEAEMGPQNHPFIDGCSMK